MIAENETSTRRPELSAAKQALLSTRLRGEGNGTVRKGTIPRRSPSSTAPLSFAQQRLWFFSQLEPDSPLYNMPTILRLRGPLRIDALERALNAIVARHESLRTHIASTDTGPVQIVDPPSATALRIIDLSGQAPSGRESELQGLIEEESRRSFDLTRDGMLRALAVRLSGTEHVLLMSMHHIASDGWSWGVFFRELTDCYEAFGKGVEPQLPDLPIQYADFAVWQRQWLQGDVLERQLAYWKSKLAGAPEVLDLQTDFPRPALQTFRGQWQSARLDLRLTEALKALSRRERVTLFMTLLAAFKVLLWRYTQQDDLLVGSAIAGRNHIETEPLIGFFINTLILRTNLGGNPTFRDFLRQVRDVTLEAYSNQDLPFEKLVEAMKPDRDPSRPPLVQVLFVLQSQANQNLRLAELEVQQVEATTRTAKFDLTLSVDEFPDGLVASVEYNTDLFDPATINRLLTHYRTLLEGVVADSGVRVADLPLLPPDERHLLLAEWNDTQTSFPEHQCVHQLFEQHAAVAPDSQAVLFEERGLTYGELNAQANHLAHHLRAMGVGPEVCVGIFLERSPEMVTAWLAVVKAGGVYVPLDPSYPQERLNYMLNDTRAPVLLTQRSLIPRWDEPSATIVCLDEAATATALRAQPSTNPKNFTTSFNTIYVIYTSGSTGGPKGVCVPHRAVNRLVMETDYVRLAASDVMAQIANSSFDATTFEVWGALLHGAKLVIVPQETLLSAQEFSQEIVRRGLTAMFITSALFNQMSRERPKLFQPMRHVLAGGEALTPKDVARVLQCGPPKRLLNGYGPTEATTFAVCHRIENVPDDATNVPIGRPIANTQTYVLDRHLNPVPIGAVGELHIGGPGLATGYLNQPELTAAKFIPNPFSSDPGARLYRTGDRARYRSDGTIECLGRTDHQVKIRGFRVELGEIESALRQHSAVRDCVVIDDRDEAMTKRLVAYVVPKHESAPTVSELRGHLQTILPEFMMPSAIGFLEALPLTPNGKVNRRALPALDASRPDLDRRYVAPRDEVEREMTKIWERVLGVEPIGVTDKFFELGGHSLLAVAMTNLIEKSFGQKLRLSAVFQCPTVELLAKVLREQKPTPIASALVEIQSKGTKPPLYFVHGVGGGMFWGYTNLSRHLGTDQPVIGLKSRGMDGVEELSRIEDMAAQYVKDVRAFQPRGPYYLGGYCFGGDVAFEMARQLELQGQVVALLALLDCSAPNSSYDRVKWTPGYAVRFLGNLFDWTRNFMQLSAARRMEYIRWKLRTFRQRFSGGTARVKSDPAKIDIDALADLSTYGDDQRALWEAHIRALISYHPKPYGGHVVLFRTRGHPPFCSFDHRNGWGDFINGPLTVQVVPGVHESMLEEPHVQVLARELRTHLEETQGKYSH